MKMRVLSIVLTALAISAIAQSGKKTWDFEKDRPGAIAKGFTSEMGEWKVVADASSPSKGNVLAQLAKSSGFNLALVSGTNYKDIDLSVKMKAIAGDEDQGGGLVWRAKDKDNYYIARFNPLEDNYRVYKVERGNRSAEFQNAAVKGDKGWHTLHVTMIGDSIECYLDGKKRLSVKDKTFQGAGRIGLWTKSDAQSHFTSLIVSTPQTQKR